MKVVQVSMPSSVILRYSSAAVLRGENAQLGSCHTNQRLHKTVPLSDTCAAAGANYGQGSAPATPDPACFSSSYHQAKSKKNNTLFALAQDRDGGFSSQGWGVGEIFMLHSISASLVLFPAMNNLGKSQERLF